MSSKVFIIGIVGGSGSGKTLLSKAVVEELEAHDLDKVAVISEDRYYKDWGRKLGAEEAAKVNYDHPDAFDHDLLKKDLLKLLKGENIHVPFYD